jgi:hypothetical protein
MMQQQVLSLELMVGEEMLVRRDQVLQGLHQLLMVQLTYIVRLLELLLVQ